MGCGGAKATAGAPPTKVEEKKEEDQVWATKTDAAKRPEQQGVQSRTGSSQPTPAKAFVLEDADDEIEIVDEGNNGPAKQKPIVPQAAQQQSQPYQQQQLRSFPAHAESRPVVSAVANPSEAPQWGGDARGDGDATTSSAGMAPGASKPLPKQQAEEAAKLAETRKKFDNQRYQAGGNAAPSMQTGDVSAVPLSLTNTIITPKEKTDLGAFLPGGVLDDLDLNELEAEVGGRSCAKADALPLGDFSPVGGGIKGGDQFDDADEALMREILEDFEDI